MNRQQYNNRRNDILETVFKDGKLIKDQSLSEIRENISKQSK